MPDKQQIAALIAFFICNAVCFWGGWTFGRFKGIMDGRKEIIATIDKIQAKLLQYEEK